MRIIEFCSVVFGVMLRLLVINILSSVYRDQQMPLLTAMSVTNLSRSGATVSITRNDRNLTTRDETRHRSILFVSTEYTNMTDRTD